MNRNDNNQNVLSYQLDELWEEMGKVIVGRKKELKLILAALLSEGHVLLEDLPGTGKTTMVKAFSKGLDCLFSRIQCTPDLLPSDVLGASIFNPKTNEFHLRKGPVFTNILLVDEINRTLPRTQSSLLECMEERQVSIEGKTHMLSSPFIVLATQNPIEMEGTFSLPEAQLDRFLMKLKLGYPTQEEETQILERVGDEIPYEDINSKFNPEKIQQLQKQCKDVNIHSSILEYITVLANETRIHPLISIGVSPRASKALYKVIKAWALLNNRDYVIPDDVKEMVKPVWNHRLILKTEAHMNNIESEDILEEILKKTDVPREKVVCL
ncbi:AAA family ATPase [Natronincola ferrireducens]|uniref:MoxR-like ATPase n=1 Tax=Natronincola ferrireducens TaxID=393762 RepID=A0A1G9E7U6_9FIRM|nr:MoxR family ATPase [Natronincola ferrireducens]SDK72188.1 MoxR-like ATPase [Natronincola ferrireducens]